MAKAQQQSAKAAAKKRIVKVDSYGDAHINATFNNLIISITNKSGQVISWSSAGKMGFKGSKKNTPYAAQMASQDASKVALDAGVKRVDVYVKGPGAGRESAIRGLAQSGIECCVDMRIAVGIYFYDPFLCGCFCALLCFCHFT